MKLIGTSLATGLERIRIETRLAKLEERTLLSQSSANDGLWDFDVESNEVYFSPRWKAMLGYADEDMRGSPDWRSLVHPDDLARVENIYTTAVQARKPYSLECRVKRHDGEYRWFLYRGLPRTLPDGIVTSRLIVRC